MPKRERLELPQASLIEDYNTESGSTWRNFRTHLLIYLTGLLGYWLLTRFGNFFSDSIFWYPWPEYYFWFALGFGGSMIGSGILVLKQTHKFLPITYGLAAIIGGTLFILSETANYIYWFLYY